MQETFVQFLSELTSIGMKDAQLYEQVKITKNAITVLQERYDELSAILLEDLKEKGLSKVETEYGKFTVAERAKWIYSPSIEVLNNNLKDAKKKEEEDGIATKEIINYLLVK